MGHKARTDLSVLRKFAGHTLIYGVSTIIARVLTFAVLTPLFVNRFPAAVYGVFTNLYAWAALLNNLLAFGMETTYFRFLDRHEGDKKVVYNNSFGVTLFTSALFLVGIILFRTDIAVGLSGWLGNGAALEDFRSYILFFGVILVADALAVVPFAKLRAEGRPIRFATVKLFNILIVVGLNLIFIVLIPYLIKIEAASWAHFDTWYRPGWLGYVFIANLVASVLTLILLLPELLKFQLRIDLPQLRKMVLYSFPILIANISFIINELLDKMVLIPRLLPPEQAATDLGIYGAVSKLAIFLSIAIQAFRLGAEPLFFSYARQANARQTYALIMDYFVILMVIAMVGLTVNIEWLKYFINAGDPLEQAKYWSGLKIVPVLLLSYVLLGVYTNLSIWYKLSDQTRYALYISGAGAIVTLVLNILVIPRYSYVGAAWVTLAAYLVMVVLSYVWGQRNYAIPYRVGKNLAYILVGILICWIAFYPLGRSLLWGNLLLVGFAAGTAVLEWKNIRRILRR